ncbi:MAG: RHS repeat-associated core domain-containing protein, partial [Acidobacteriota bacterium]
ATNRLTGASYDAGGNLTGFTLLGEEVEYDYDPLNMMKHLRSNTDQARVFLYDADDERILTFDCPADDCASQEARTTATIRSLDNKVLRVYEQVFGESWDWQRDYVYREGSLLAAVEPGDSGGEATVHFHLDHLGTPRQITDASGVEVAFHSYYPFGGEATEASQDDRALKFTGHERDGNGSAGAGMLDYMHARYCSPGLGRFLSKDPVRSEAPSRPQSWNRYAYARNSPLTRLDPDGQDDVMIGFEQEFARAIQARAGTGPDPIGRTIGAGIALSAGAPLIGAAIVESPVLAATASSGIASKFAIRYATQGGFLGASARMIGRLSQDSSIPVRRQGVDFLQAVQKGYANIQQLSAVTRETFARQFDLVALKAFTNPNRPASPAKIRAFIFNRERARFLRGETDVLFKNAKEAAAAFSKEIEFYLSLLP